MTSAKLAVAALAVLALAPAASNAALMTGQDLVAACSGDTTGKAVCDGYLMAVTDAVLQRESRGRTGGKVCLPQNVTIDQVREAVLTVASRPRAVRAPAGVRVVIAALRITWPCAGEPPNGAPPPR